MFPGVKPLAESCHPFGINPRVPLRDGFSMERVPGNKLPGYDHSVPPPGQRPTIPFGTTALKTYPLIRFPYLATAIPTFTCLMASSTN
jgi:hypothetical protein